jgi:hypothetical protein
MDLNRGSPFKAGKRNATYQIAHLQFSPLHVLPVRLQVLNKIYAVFLDESIT